MATRLIGTDSDDPWLPDIVKVRADKTRITDAAGNFISPSVEGALAELSDMIDDVVATGGGLPAASNAETIAGVIVNKAVTPASLAFERPYIDVRSYGAVGDGTTDDTVAIQAALDAAASGVGGVVLVPKGIWRITAPVVVPSNVGLEGVGSTWGLMSSSLHASTMFKATTATAKIVVDGNGPGCGNFSIDGTDVATGPLLWRRVLGAKRLFTSIGLYNSTTEAWRIDNAQNETWIDIHLNEHGGAGLVIDQGAGGNQFLGCEFARTATWSLIITETTGTGPYSAPTHNTFDHCLFELSKTGVTPKTGCAQIKTGARNVFRDCVFNPVSAVSDAVIHVDGSGLGADPIVAFDGCWIACTAAGATGIIQDAGMISLYGMTEFLNLLHAWKFNAGSVNIAGSVTYTSVTNRFDPASAGSRAQFVLSNNYRPVQVWAESNDFYFLRCRQFTEPNPRLDIDPTGKLSWGSGSAAADVNLFRSSNGVIRTEGLWITGTTFGIQIAGPLNHDGTTIGFYNSTPVTKPTVTGAKGSNAALGSLLTALANLGLITDSSTA